MLKQYDGDGGKNGAFNNLCFFKLHYHLASSRRAKTEKIALFVLMERCTRTLLEIIDNFFETIFNEFRLASWRSMSNNICTLLG